MKNRGWLMLPLSFKEVRMNREIQYYKNIPLRLIIRNYGGRNAKRYTLNGTNQNVWIPNKHLLEDGTIKSGENIDYVFRKAQRQLMYAGLHEPIIGIKRRTTPDDLLK